MTNAKKTSYFCFAILAALTVYLQLGPEILAGVFAYFILDLVNQQLTKAVPKSAARWLSVGIFLVLAACLVWLFALFLRLTLVRLPVILSAFIPRLNAFADNHGIALPFGNVPELRDMVLDEIKKNAQTVTKASSLLTTDFFEIVVSILIAVVFHLHPSSGGALLNSKGAKLKAEFSKVPPNLTFLDLVAAEFDDRVDIFMRGFEKIFWIQILLVFIRTGIIAIFLLLMDIHSVHFLLLATFILGFIPVFGAIVSGALIVGTAFTLSAHLALFTVIFLFALHQVEYLLYGRLAGSEMAAPTWQILVGLLIGEKILGIAGMILAPAVIHYFREELRRLPAS